MAVNVCYNKYSKYKRIPIVNICILTICLVIYIVPALTAKMNFLPALINSNSNLYDSIMQKLCFVPTLILHQPWRIFTCAFLHASLLHIVFNMYALIIIGIPLERALGKLRFFAIYILSILGSALTITIISGLFSNDNVKWFTPTVGASGGIFGLLGATFFVVKALRFPTTNITTTVILNFVISIAVPNISWEGHLGGLLLGGLTTWLLINLPYKKQKLFSLIYCLSIAIGLIILIFVVIEVSHQISIVQ